MTEVAPWTLLHAQIHRVLTQRQLLPKRQQLLVAVSGGQDSLCLMRLLLDLQPKWGWELAVAHCNHRWRPDADANADYIQQLAKTWNVSYYSVTAAQVATSEAAARQWRYQQLTELAITHGCASVVTGHTASDRAETLLYNLMRGSGADGLQALVWQRKLAANVQLVRPLLEMTRSQTAAFCQQCNLQVWQDATNQDLKYARNRIRHEVLPYLKTHFNPQVEQTLAQTAELLRADVEYLEAAAEAMWPQIVKEGLASSDTGLENNQENHRSDQAWGLNRAKLSAVPLALQRRLIRQFLKSTLPLAPSFEHIEKVVALLSAPNRSQSDPFPGGLIALVDKEWIWLVRS